MKTTREINCEKCNKIIDKVDFLIGKCKYCNHRTVSSIEYNEFKEKNKILWCPKCTFTYSTNDLNKINNKYKCKKCSNIELKDISN